MNSNGVTSPELGGGPGKGVTPFTGLNRDNRRPNAAIMELARAASAATASAEIRVISHDGSINDGDESGGEAEMAAQAHEDRNARGSGGKTKPAGEAAPSAKPVRLDDIPSLLKQQEEIAARIAANRRGEAMDDQAGSAMPEKPGWPAGSLGDARALVQRRFRRISRPASWVLPRARVPRPQCQECRERGSNGARESEAPGRC